MLFRLLWIFFRLTFFTKNLSGIPSECQTVWIQIRPNVLSGLIWVQTVCRCYQQMTKVATSGERVKYWKFNVVSDYPDNVITDDTKGYFLLSLYQNIPGDKLESP